MSVSRGREYDQDELVLKAQAGDAGAFDRLVEIYTPRLYQVVRRFASDRGEAEAIVQETWLRAWRALPRTVKDRPMGPWLVRIAVNVTRDIWRKKKPLDFADTGGEEDFLQDERPGPEERMSQKEALESLVRGVERLRPEYRMVIALRYDAVLSYQEIASALNLPVNTVRTHLHRAKNTLRNWLETNDA
ncbi:MAG TPA: sigma-70 family RNA polymerase sigma factor [Anaerolineae bacterium]|nr:sigma-70 family RNA polymerase sigma factor [Anaerolineae bacterium]